MGLKDGLPGRQTKLGKFICTKCRVEECHECIDLKRSVYTQEKICSCPRHKTTNTASGTKGGTATSS